MSVEYTSFLDNGLTLPKSNGDIDEDVQFATPNVDTTKNGVLSFEANPTSGNPTLTLKVNGTQIYSVRFANNVQRVAQENIRQSILQANNTLSVEVSGGGSLQLSDCFMLYKAA